MKEVIMGLPSPAELIFNPISYIVFAMYGGLMIWEWLFPARQLPEIKHWKLRGIVSFTVFFFLSSYLPLLWDGYLAEFQVFDLTFLGTVGGAFVGLLIYQFAFYAWHRNMHKSNKLWRVFHQMHHSAERMDTFSAFYLSPMDMIAFTLLGSFCLVVIGGFTPAASTLFLLISTFLAIFQHSNIKTPQWLGYIIQRPEAHTVHHARGIHAHNYCDLPFIDMIFRTFKNPATYENETGFYDGASARVVEMIIFKDVSEEK